jgi:hypothetical protein
VALVYAAHCWQMYASSTAVGGRRRLLPSALWVERIAAIVLASGVVMHAGLAIDRALRQSLYLDRPLVQAAIDARNDRFLGDRRDSLLETRDRRARPIDPVADRAAFDRAEAASDLVLSRAEWAPAVFGVVSGFRVEIRNDSRFAAYVDIRYTARYRSAGGAEVAVREGVIKEILQPGAARRWGDITNGLVPAGAVSATFLLDGAEKVVPRILGHN